MNTKKFNLIMVISLLIMILPSCGVSITKNCYYNGSDPKSKKPTSTETVIKTERLPSNK